MERDPKLVENLDGLIHDVMECKQSLEMLLMNLSNNEAILAENKLDWPTMLNSLRIVSANLISISKFIREKGELVLKTSVILPKIWSEDVDQELQEISQNRISIFNQDVIPHILRTKLIPALEEQESKLQKSAKDLQQIKAFDKNFKKTIDEAANMVEKPKRDMDNIKGSLNTETYNLRDTLDLVRIMENSRNVSRPPGQRAFDRVN